MAPNDPIKAYTRAGLHLYDALIMGLFAKHVWRCPPARFVAHYRKHLTSNHAEIGVGTGYCLDRCGFDFDSHHRRLALIDLQPNCLEFSARRLARYQPQTHVHDARLPLPYWIGRFDSIAIAGVLHCLPGGMHEKAKVFDALRPLASGGATVFGYTLVSDSVSHRRRSRWMHRALNHLRVIDNTGDRLDDLRDELSRRFVACNVEPVGCLAFFSATFPRGLAT